MNETKCPPRHTERQLEIINTLSPELRFEFWSDEMAQITAWFAYADQQREAVNARIDK